MACGSAVLAGVLSLVGATGLLTTFPLERLAFSLLATVALLLSMYWLADGMRGGDIRGCPGDVCEQPDKRMGRLPRDKRTG